MSIPELTLVLGTVALAAWTRWPAMALISGIIGVLWGVKYLPTPEWGGPVLALGLVMFFTGALGLWKGA